MSTDIGTLKGRIELTDSYTGVLDTVKRHVQDVTNTMSKFAGVDVAGPLTGMTNALTSAAGVSAIATAAFGAATYAALELSESAAAAGARLLELSHKTSASVEEIGALDFMAKALGRSAESMAGAFFMMSRRVAQGADEMKDGIKTLSLNWQSWSQLKPDEQVLQVSDAMRKLPADVNKANIAFQVFGRMGREMLPMLLEDMSGLTEEGRSFNTWTTEAAEQAEEFDIQLNIMHQWFSKLWSVVGRDLLPIFAEWIKELKESGFLQTAIPAAGHAIANAFKVLLGAVEAVVKVFGWLKAVWDAQPEAMRQFEKVVIATTIAIWGLNTALTVLNTLSKSTLFTAIGVQLLSMGAWISETVAMIGAFGWEGLAVQIGGIGTSLTGMASGAAEAASALGGVAGAGAAVGLAFTDVALTGAMGGDSVGELKGHVEATLATFDRFKGQVRDLTKDVLSQAQAMDKDAVEALRSWTRQMEETGQKIKVHKEDIELIIDSAELYVRAQKIISQNNLAIEADFAKFATVDLVGIAKSLLHSENGESAFHTWAKAAGLADVTIQALTTAVKQYDEAQKQQTEETNKAAEAQAKLNAELAKAKNNIDLAKAFRSAVPTSAYAMLQAYSTTPMEIPMSYMMPNGGVNMQEAMQAVVDMKKTGIGSLEEISKYYRVNIEDLKLWEKAYTEHTKLVQSETNKQVEITRNGLSELQRAGLEASVTAQQVIADAEVGMQRLKNIGKPNEDQLNAVADATRSYVQKSNELWQLLASAGIDQDVWAYVQQQYDAMWQHDIDVANNSQNTLIERMKKHGVDTVQVMQQQADDIRRVYEQMIESNRAAAASGSPLPWTDAQIESAKRRWQNYVNSITGTYTWSAFFKDVGETLSQTFSNINSKFGQIAQIIGNGLDKLVNGFDDIKDAGVRAAMQTASAFMTLAGVLGQIGGTFGRIMSVVMGIIASITQLAGKLGQINNQGGLNINLNEQGGGLNIGGLNIGGLKKLGGLLGIGAGGAGSVWTGGTAAGMTEAGSLGAWSGGTAATGMVETGWGGAAGSSAGASAGGSAAGIGALGAAGIVGGLFIGSVLGISAMSDAETRAWEEAMNTLRDYQKQLASTYVSFKDLQSLAKMVGMNFEQTVFSGQTSLEEFQKYVQDYAANMEKFAQKMADIKDMLSRNNLTAQDLGPVLQQYDINARTDQIAKDFEMMVNSGLSTDEAVKLLSGSLNTLVYDAAKAGQKIPQALEYMVAKMVRLGLVTQQTAEMMLGLADTTMPSLQEITDAAERYGLTLEELGGKVNQLYINTQADQIVKDFNLLTRAGADFTSLMNTVVTQATDAQGNIYGVIGGMRGQIENLVQQSLEFGYDLPAQLKPIVQKMIDAGLLFDAGGNKIDDITKLDFAADLTAKMDDLIAALEKLTDVFNTAGMAHIPEYNVPGGGTEGGGGGSTPGGGDTQQKAGGDTDFHWYGAAGKMVKLHNWEAVIRPQDLTPVAPRMSSAAVDSQSGSRQIVLHATLTTKLNNRTVAKEQVKVFPSVLAQAGIK